MDEALYRQRRAEIIRQINRYTSLRNAARSEAASYQNKVNAHTQELQRLNTLLSQTREKLRQCQDSIALHERLLVQIKGYETRFTDGVSERVARVRAVESYAQTVAFARGYAAAMGNVLTGSAFQQTHSGITAGKKTTMVKISALISEQSSLRRAISNLEQQIRDTERARSAAQSQCASSESRAHQYQAEIDRLQRQLRNLDWQAAG
jgi:chromosome segregation ATPase